MLRAHEAWVGTIRRESTREERAELKSSRDKKMRHEPWWGGGEKSLHCDTPDLRIDQEGEKIINGMGKKKEENALRCVPRP